MGTHAAITRTLFWGESGLGKELFYLIGWSAIAIAIAGIAHHVLKYRRARSLPTPLDWASAMKSLVSALMTHRTVRRRDSFAGFTHAGVFFGFVLLFLGTITITLDYDIVRPIWHASFWTGAFFLGFKLTMDAAGLAATLGLGALIVRRAWFHLPKLVYLRTYRGETELRPAARRWQAEDWAFSLALLFIFLTGFLEAALRNAMDRPTWALQWEPVGHALGNALLLLHLRPQSMRTLRVVNWWVHGMAALTFVAALPWYKAKHMLAALGSLAARDPLTLARLPAVPKDAARPGVATMADFTWKDMLDFDACTRCGRCHEACPAQAAGLPLSPRDLILDLRAHNERVQGRSLDGPSLLGTVIAPETLWACRTCGACQEICPVGIEHPVKIVKLRRQLVEQRQMDPLLEQTLAAIGNTGNSFGESARQRSAWTRALPFEVKDIRREAAENLWFVGDYASYDPRNQAVSRAFASLLHVARVDFGLLHEGERTAGNDVRRVGEEALFESLAEHNLAQMAGARPFSSIITTDPHSFNTIRNEYPELGRVAPIRHYTQVLRELLESGRLKVVNPLGLSVTFHDPCHLGRLNKRYDDPRKVLELIGCRLVEMPRNRDNSFCCGAGGGRIWMADPPGKKKPSQLRVEEAAALGGIDVFVTCCPKDLTMFEDARKTSGLEQAFVVEDIAELVARAINLNTLQLHDVPRLIESISKAVAEIVVERVAERVTQLLGTGSSSEGVRSIAPRLGAEAPSESEPPREALDTEGAPVAAPPVLELRAKESDVLSAQGEWLIQPVPPAVFPAYLPPAKAGRRLLVAVKHVARLGDEIAFESDGRHLRPELLEYQLNEFDDTALEQALRTGESLGGCEIVVVTVGPPEAEATVRKALAKGAHRAVRVWADSLADADPIMIARMLSGVALAEQPDLVFCGVQSSDQANGATGSALAALLGLPCAAVAVETHWDGSERLQVTRELEGGLRHRFVIGVPAVLTIQSGANMPRYATMRMVKEAKAKPIAEIDAAAEATAYEAASLSALQHPSVTRATMLVGNPDELAEQIFGLIQSKIGGAS